MSSDNSPISKAELLSGLQQGWDDLQAYVASHSPEQMTGPTDAAGWTAKDHVAHLARWAEGIVALLNRESRSAAMGLDEEMFSSRDFDAMNAIIRERDVDRSLEDVMRLYGDIHRRLVEQISAMSDEDLARPYREYQPTSNGEWPVSRSIAGNTYEHYLEEHRAWMDAIINSGS